MCFTINQSPPRGNLLLWALVPRRHLLLPTAAEVGKSAASLSRWTPLLHQRAYEIPTSRISYGAVPLLTYLFSPKNHGRKKGEHYRICSRYQKAFESAKFRICCPLSQILILHFSFKPSEASSLKDSIYSPARTLISEIYSSDALS